MQRLSHKIPFRFVALAFVLAMGAGCGSNSPEASTDVVPDGASPEASGSVSSPDASGQDSTSATTQDASLPDATAETDAPSQGVPTPDASTADGSMPGPGLDAGVKDVATGDVSAEASTPPADGSTAPVDGATPDASSASDASTPDASTADASAATVGLVNPRTVPVTPAIPLPVNTGATLPANGDVNVPVDTLLRIGFDGPPAIGMTGTINIHKVSDDSIVDTINVADPYAVYDGSNGDAGAADVNKLFMNTTSTKVNVIGGLTSGIDQVRVVNYIPILVSGNTATIVPHNNHLAYATAYYVTIDAGLLTGAISGTAFGGITSTTAWTFTTKAAAPTTLNVAADNSADFATVQGAIDAVAAGSSAALTINIAPGVYQEMLFIRNKKNITFLGTNNGLDAVIQYDNSDGFNPAVGAAQAVTTPGAGGTIPGYGGAAVADLAGGGRAVLLTTAASGIVLDGITIMNTHAQASRVLPTLPAPTTVAAGATSSATFLNYASAVTQAETVYFNTSFSATAAPGTLVATHSNFVSYQDTLELKGFSWFYDCFVTGDVDFIWGNPNAALFERSEIKSRVNANGASVVQSRAYLSFGATATPATFNQSYPGFVFLDCALTKEPGTFTAYLARSPGAATVSGAAPTFFYLQYDIVSYIGCSMDTHIAPAGWNVVGGNPTGANALASPVVGWREYKSITPQGAPVDVSQRLVNPSPAGTTANPGGSIQLTDANAATFFANRGTILQGATDGTFTTTGLATFLPSP